MHHSIGGVFKRIRKNRGLTIEQVKGDLSIATVSRFENNTCELSLTSFICLLENMALTPIEFFRFYNWLCRDNDSKQENLSDRLVDLELNKRLRSTTVNGLTNNGFCLNQQVNLLAMAAIKAIELSKTNGTAKMDELDQERVCQYLLETDLWLDFEFFLFASTIQGLDDARFELLYSRLMTIQLGVRPHYYNNQWFPESLYKTAIRKIEMGRADEALVLLDQMVTQNSPETDFYFKERLLFAKSVCQFQQDPSRITERNVALLLRVTAALNLKIYRADVNWLLSVGIVVDEGLAG